MAVETRGRAAGPPAFVTPDAVELDLEVATVGSRGVAYLLDLLLLFAGLLVLGLAQAALVDVAGLSSAVGVASLLLLVFAWQFGYPIGFEVLWRGRTLGKAAMGLRVVTVEGAPVGVRHATIRAVVALLELLGTFGLVAVVSSFASDRGQRLGDLAAGTLVIRERRAGAAPAAERFEVPEGYVAYTDRLDVSAVRADEYAMVRDALRRARELPASAREQVLGAVAARVAPRISPVPPAGTSAEALLRCVAAAVQRRRPAVTGRPPSEVAAAGAERPAADAGAGAARPAPADGAAEGDVRPPSQPPSAEPGRTGGFQPPA